MALKLGSVAVCHNLLSTVFFLLFYLIYMVVNFIVLAVKKMTDAILANVLCVRFESLDIGQNLFILKRVKFSLVRMRFEDCESLKHEF